MNKAILVIDMPDSCIKCPVCASYQASAFSTREVWCATNGKDVEPYSKPDWCPLMPAPEEQMIWYEDGRSDWERGYNNCVYEILGRERDYE
jgi:hypothetical protein